MKVVKKRIDMLCWSDKDGNISPIRFRLIDDSGENIIIRVEKIIKKRTEKLAGNKMLVFSCQSIINNSLKNYEIKYELESCKWTLFKI